MRAPRGLRAGLTGRLALLIGAAVLGVTLAWAAYRPERERPFRVVDFSEFLPLLERGGDVLGGTRELATYYAGQGRFNVIPYFLMATKWSAFGAWSPGWQLPRAALMLLLVGLTYLLLRRLGATALGAVVGASVYLWAPSASDGWVQLTMAEPPGAALMLGASLLAVGYQRSRHWQRDAGVIAIAAAALILSKELLAPLILLPLGLALTVQPDGTFARPRPDRRTLGLVAGVGLASLLALTPIAVLYLRADPSAYAALYGQAPQSPFVLLAAWIAALIPFDAAPSPASPAWAVAVVGFTVLVASGWRVGFQHPVEGRRARWLLALAVLVPLAGVLAYLPSPWYARFYSLPYLIGTAVFMGMAATYLQRHAPHGTAWALSGWGAATVFALAGAAEHAARADARQRRDDAVVARVAALGADSVWYATSRPPPYEWLGMGATLRRYAAATHRQWPPTRDVACERASGTTDTTGFVVVSFLEDGCSVAARGATVMAVQYRRMDWNRWMLVADSAAAVVSTRAGVDTR